MAATGTPGLQHVWQNGTLSTCESAGLALARLGALQQWESYPLVSRALQDRHQKTAEGKIWIESFFLTREPDNSCSELSEVGHIFVFEFKLCTI